MSENMMVIGYILCLVFFTYLAYRFGSFLTTEKHKNPIIFKEEHYNIVFRVAKVLGSNLIIGSWYDKNIKDNVRTFSFEKIPTDAMPDKLEEGATYFITENSDGKVKVLLYSGSFFYLNSNKIKRSSIEIMSSSQDFNFKTGVMVEGFFVKLSPKRKDLFCAIL